MNLPDAGYEGGERTCPKIAREAAGDAQGADRVRWDGRLRDWHVSSRAS